MTDSITNPSPKSRFMESTDNVSKHKTLVDSKEFQRGSDAAMAEYVALLCLQTAPANFNINSFKIQGAQEFLYQFRMLAEKQQGPPPRVVSDNLNHQLS